MADGTHIEWTDATWNPITGCSVVSPGCTNCYAMKLAGTRLKHHWSRKGLTVDTKAGPVWNGELRFNEEWLDQPLRWTKPRMIFVCAHGDLFHEDVPDEWIDKVFAIMAMAPQHIFQVLTKRPARMRQYLTVPPDGVGEEGGVIIDRPHWLQSVCETLGGRAEAVFNWPLPNVWLGTSCETQHWLMQRACHLVETPAAVRWLSLEPLLGELDLEPFLLRPRLWSTAWHNNYPFWAPKHQIDWVVAGGESGPGARAMHPDCVRSIRDQCASASVPFFFKQWGDWSWAERVEGNPETLAPYRIGKKAAGRLLDGVTYDAMPAPVREPTNA